MPKINQSETSEHTHSVVTQAEYAESSLLVELNGNCERILLSWKKIEELLQQCDPSRFSLVYLVGSLQQEFEGLANIAFRIKKEVGPANMPVLMHALDAFAGGINNFRRFIQNYDARDAHNILETEKFREKISEFEEKVSDFIAFNVRSQ